MKNAELKTSQPSVLISLGSIMGICPFVYFSLTVLFQANRF